MKITSPDAIGSFFGIPVVESEFVPLPEGSLGGFIFDAAAFRIYAPKTETRPFTDLEREGEWAKRAVRHGLADVLGWLGQDAGPEPDAAYTDMLYKTSMLSTIARSMP